MLGVASNKKIQRKAGPELPIKEIGSELAEQTAPKKL